MSEFGKFTELTFINGTVPAISATNLNEMQRILNLTDDELSRSAAQQWKFYKEYFWQRNCKLIDDMNSISGWAADASTSVAADTTNFLVGIQSVRYTETDNVAGWIGISKSLTAANLNQFNDGLLSSGSDSIMWEFYVSDITKFTHIQFKLGTDNSNNYAFLYNAASLRTGWNCIYAKKDDAIVAGSPDWASITYIRAEATTPAGSINAYISIQLCMLYRVDPYSDAYYTPFQKYLSGGYAYEGPEIFLDTWALYYDPVIRDLGIMMLDTRAASNNEKALHVYCSIINFIAKFELYCKSAGSSPSFTWWVDSNNYIEGYISSDVLYLDFIEAGVSSSHNISLTNGLVLNERYEIVFEKQSQLVRIILFKDSEPIKKLEYDTSISITSDGCLYLGCHSTGCNGFLTNYSISNTQKVLIDSWDTPRVIWKVSDQVINNSTTFIDCTDMFVDLPPNGIFLIEANIASYNETTDAADLKVRWALSGDVTQLKGKHIFTLPSNITTCLDSNVKATVYDLITTNTVGHDATSNETLTYERFLVYTKNTGGRLQLQFAQNTANASDTYVDNQSFMIVTKLKR